MELLKTLLFITIAVLGFIYVRWFWRSYYQDFWVILQQWADAQGYQFVHRERCSSMRTPFAWWTSRYQVVFYITVVDKDGNQYTGWVRCGSTYGQNIRQVDVQWKHAEGKAER